MRHSKKTPLLTINLRNHKLNQKAYFVISAKTYGPLSLHHWISQVRSCLWHCCTFYLLLRNDRLLATWRFFICSNCSSNKETLLLIDCFSRIVKTNPTWRSCSRCRTWAWSTTTSTWVDLWGFKFFSKVSSRSQKLFFPQGQTSQTHFSSSNYFDLVVWLHFFLQSLCWHKTFLIKYWCSFAFSIQINDIILQILGFEKLQLNDYVCFEGRL